MQPIQGCFQQLLKLFRVSIGWSHVFLWMCCNNNVLCVVWLQLDEMGKPKVLLSCDDTSGRPRGDGIVGYESPQSAIRAIMRFNSKFAFNCIFDSKR